MRMSSGIGTLPQGYSIVATGMHFCILFNHCNIAIVLSPWNKSHPNVLAY